MITCVSLLCLILTFKFLLVVHMNLMKFICNERNHSTFILQQKCEVHAFNNNNECRTFEQLQLEVRKVLRACICNLKQSNINMLHILTIAARKVIHTYIRNLKLSNIDIQQEYVVKKGVYSVII